VVRHGCFSAFWKRGSADDRLDAEALRHELDDVRRESEERRQALQSHGLLPAAQP
jgi:hypothetical protein